MKKTLLFIAVSFSLQNFTNAETLTASEMLPSNAQILLAATTTNLTTIAMPNAAPTSAENKARSYQKWLNQINVPYANQLGLTNGKGVLVGIADTGIQSTHPMLKGQIAGTYNAFTGTKDVTDTQGHGTFTASEIVGTLANGALLEGVAPGASLLVAKIFDSKLPTTNNVADKGVTWLVQNKASIISLSLGAGGPVMSNSLQSGVKAGALFTIAAGNDAAASVSWPARYAKETWAYGQVIVVGSATQATNGTWSLSSFSNKAGDVANWYVVAPGQNTSAGYLNSQYGYMSGTSMATPMVAGQAALLKSLWPQLKADEMAQIIFKTATHLCSDKTTGSACLNRTTADSVYGWGLINVGKSLQPIGTLSVRTASGNTLNLSKMSLGSVSGAVAVKVKSAADQGAFLIAGVDGYNRQYQYDAGQTLRLNTPNSVTQMFQNSDRLLRYNEVALDTQGSRMAILSTHLSDNAVSAYAPNAQNVSKDTLAGAAWVQKLSSGNSIAGGTGSMNLFFGLAGSRDVEVSALGQNVLANPYLGLVSQASSAGYGFQIGEHTQVKLGIASSKLSNTLSGQYGVYASTPAQSQLAIAEVSHQFKNGEMGIELTNLTEKQALLGTQLGNGFTLGNQAQTAAVTIHGAMKLSEHMALAGYVSEGYTRGYENSGNSLVTSVSNARSEAFGVGLSYTEAFQPKDRLTVSLSSPLATRSGQINMNVPTNVDENGVLIRENRTIALGDANRELRAEANYTVPLSDRSALSTTLMLRQNANQVVGEKEVGIALRYSLRF